MSDLVHLQMPEFEQKYKSKIMKIYFKNGHFYVLSISHKNM